MKKDYGKYLGSLLMTSFGVFAIYRWHQTGLIFFLLLVVRDFAAGYFFLKRNPADKKAGLVPSILSYLSSAMPLMYLSPTSPDHSMVLASNLLSVAGFLLVVFATLELGKSIGISPANRGLVQSGVYKYMKHPMYTGYVVSEIGMVLLNTMNLWIFGVSVSLYALRAMAENRILTHSRYLTKELV